MTNITQLYQLTSMKMPEYKLQLTIHGVVAGRGLAAEAAPFGEALRLGYRAWSTGETLSAREVAL